MIDPLISLAFAMHSNKGVYAVLLGSGVSRAAGIPTGWEVVLDLTRKLAHVQNEECEPDPAAWFQDNYGHEPDYSKLLDMLAKTPTERSHLLRAYFEPTDEEREQGRKTPTIAHTSIASLVASGYIRVIITTNFDRLMETALQSVGIVPTVISTPDAAEGAAPVTHTQCTVLKVHGDYLDTRIKNTPSELAKYDRRIRKLLDRILDEFGLIVCGWSGEWDTALRGAIERCKSRRFTTIWATIGQPGTAAKSLIELRKADVVNIKGADSFFQDLAEKVTALEEFSRPHPLSTAAAVAALKRYLPEPQHRIRLEDLVTRETEIVADLLSGERFPNKSMTYDDVLRRLYAYEKLLDTPIKLITSGCYWGDSSQDVLWTRMLERIANATDKSGMFTDLNDLALYPALVLLYSAGIAAIANGRYETLRSLLMDVRIRERQQEHVCVERLETWQVVHENVQRKLSEAKKSRTPLSEHLHDILREPLRALLRDNDRYTHLFDRFEYLRSLVSVRYDMDRGEEACGCVGRFGSTWRPMNTILEVIEKEAQQLGPKWPPLALGLFESEARFWEVKKAHDNFIKQAAKYAR